jgi:alkaline phosphatase
MTRLRLIPLVASALFLAAPAIASTEEDTAAYRAQGEAELQRLKADQAPRTKARNVIVFIGDGMGVSTLTAARIFAGQAMGRDGESNVTVMDGLAHTALVKTYSHDAQVSDSAPTATAIMAGVKTRASVLGIGRKRGLTIANRARPITSPR